jgi:hypothetical protein
MLTQVKSAAARSSATLVHDAIGVAALMIILAVALHLPSLT